MKSILIVDDSSTVRDMVLFVLKDTKFLLAEAEDGLEALGLATCKQFDLIITDLNMPNMTGIELAEALRNLENYRNTPILMLTTESDPVLKQKGKDLGLTGWVMKPLSPARFKPAVEKLLAV